METGNRIAENTYIADGVTIGKNVTIEKNSVVNPGCVIGNNVVIGQGSHLDYGVIVRENVTVKGNGMIGSGCILGEYLAEFYRGGGKYGFHPLVIGENAVIRSGSIIYGDNILGDNLETGHRVTVRERSRIGNCVRIGTLSDIQGDCEIQDYVRIHSNVFVGQKSIIKKYAWLLPCAVLTNDPNPPSESILGVSIEEFAVISARAVILPGVTVGKGALVGAGAVVTKNVDADMAVVGNPARILCHTDGITDDVTGRKVYPWQYTFDRGMPWQGMGYEQWEEEQHTWEKIGINSVMED